MTVKERGQEIIEEIYNTWDKGDPENRISIDLENKILIYNIADLNNLHTALKNENAQLKDKLKRIEVVLGEFK